MLPHLLHTRTTLNALHQHPTRRTALPAGLARQAEHLVQRRVPGTVAGGVRGPLALRTGARAAGVAGGHEGPTPRRRHEGGATGQVTVRAVPCLALDEPPAIALRPLRAEEVGQKLVVRAAVAAADEGPAAAPRREQPLVGHGGGEQPRHARDAVVMAAGHEDAVTPPFFSAGKAFGDGLVGIVVVPAVAGLGGFGCRRAMTRDVFTASKSLFVRRRRRRELNKPQMSVPGSERIHGRFVFKTLRKRVV